MRSLNEIKSDPANLAARVVEATIEQRYIARVPELSDELLAADIVLLENVITHGTPSPLSTRRYKALVTERHRRTLERGRKQEQELLYVRKMLEELALFHPDDSAPWSGWSYEVDDVVRGEDGNIVTIVGTATSHVRKGRHEPYILGEVQ
jgi:hypothetical protein